MNSQVQATGTDGKFLLCALGTWVLSKTLQDRADTERGEKAETIAAGLFLFVNPLWPSLS